MNPPDPRMVVDRRFLLRVCCPIYRQAGPESAVCTASEHDSLDRSIRARRVVAVLVCGFYGVWQIRSLTRALHGHLLVALDPLDALLSYCIPSTVK